MSYFLKIDEIEGDSAAVGHESWFDVDGVQWGVALVNSEGSGSGRRAGKPRFQPVAFTGATSGSTPLLMRACAMGKRIRTATLEVVHDSDGRSALDLRIDFGEATLSALTIEGSDGATPFRQAFSLDYATVTMTTFVEDEKGAVDEGSTASWDIRETRI